MANEEAREATERPNIYTGKFRKARTIKLSDNEYLKVQDFIRKLRVAEIWK